MRIVDAQVHIWSGAKPANPNHRQVASFTKDDLLKEMDAAGVDAPSSIRRRHGTRTPTSWPSRRRASSRPARDPRELSARQAGEPRADRRLEEAAGHARPALHVLAAAPEDVADRRHHRLGVGRGRARGHPGGAARGQFPAEGRAGRRAASGTQADHRSPRAPVGHEGRRGLGNLGDMLALAKHPNVAIKAPARRATRASPIPIATSTVTCGGSTTPSAPRGCSGAPTSRACRARGGSA